MLFDNCGLEFALPNCMDCLNRYTYEITFRTATSPKMKWVGQVERMEKFEIFTNLADNLKEVL